MAGTDEMEDDFIDDFIESQSRESRSITGPRSLWQAQARARARARRAYDEARARAWLERLCQPNLYKDSRTGAMAYPPYVQWKYHWDREHDRWHSKGIRVGPPGGGSNTLPGRHTRRNKANKVRKEWKKYERLLEDLLDPAGEAGRQAARDEKRRREFMRSAARWTFLALRRYAE